MANGQQNLEAFEVWQATQTDDDFTQIIYRGQLHHGKVAKALGCGKSTLTQNPSLSKALKALEESLHERGFLPPLLKQQR